MNIQIGQKCRYCGKWRSPGFMIRLSDSVQMCRECVHTAPERAARLAALPKTCEECDKPFSAAPGFLGSDKTVVEVVFQDGKLHAFCTPCRIRWEQKRLDLFRGTAHGRLLNAN